MPRMVWRVLFIEFIFFFIFENVNKLIIIIIIYIIVITIILQLALSSGCCHADIHPKGASHNKYPRVPWGHSPGT